MIRKCIAAIVFTFLCLPLSAQRDSVDTTPKISGTLRGKYEYQTGEGEGRFEVRTARVSVSGKLTPVVSYKAEIDLCDEGVIKMLDAYTQLAIRSDLDFTIGQMRVPFTIDAHRSPHQQYCANRSFIAKQVGKVRDVGAKLGYEIGGAVPVSIEAGIFNGSGLTNQKNFWTSNINFSTKAQFHIPGGTTLVLSAQKIKPEDIIIMMYDAGLTYRSGGLIAEVEYLYKHYDEHAFQAVHAFDSFVSYDIPLRRGPFSKVSPLVRYDYMTDHSDGTRYLDGKANAEGSLIINDYRRGRLTGGVTLSFLKLFASDIRINYEKYFYRAGAVPKASEKDKIVIEFMTRF